jgi:cyclophilin family peptidyl-prolyl cis-trans isomerase
VSKASKRERQRLNRETRRELELAAEKRRRQFKTARNIGLILLPLVVLFVVLQVVRSDEKSDADSGKKTFVTLTTTKGDITIRLDPSEAPETAKNFEKLVQEGFYNGLNFHRVTTGIIQSGDPNGDGTGGPGYTIEDEFPTKDPYAIGDVAMANKGTPNSGGSQFFIITGEAGTQLPPQYSRFGRVVQGLDVAQQIQALVPPNGDGPPTEQVQIVQAVAFSAKRLPPTTTTAPAAPPSS